MLAYTYIKEGLFRLLDKPKPVIQRPPGRQWSG